MWDAEGKYYTESNKPLIEKNGDKLSHDPDFRGMKVEGRKFNDVLFGLLFIFMFIAMGAVNFLAFTKGNPESLMPSSKYINVTTHEQRAELWFQDAVAHLKRDVDIVGMVVGLSFVLGIVWVQLMKMFTKIFIYTTMFLGVILVTCGGGYSLFIGIHKGNESMKIFSYVLFGIAFLLAVGIVFLRKKINLTCEIFNECCRGVQRNPSLFAIGTIVFILMAAFMAYWIAGFIFLYSIPGKSVDVISENTHHMPVFNTKIRNLMYFNVFGFFWTNAFISAVFQMSVAGAIASWYFSRDINGYNTMKGSPAFRSFGFALSKSFGSLAFGSLILATVQFLNFLVNRMKNVSSTNRLLKCFVCLAKCLLACTERWIRFINRYTYVSLAMHGDGFCTSARNVFDLMSRNMFSAVVVDLLGDFVLCVGKLLGVAICTLFSFGMLHALDREISPVTIASVIVVSFLIFNLFSHIVGVGVDTVFVCYLEDLERNNGSNLFAEPSLHRILQERAGECRVNS